MSTSIGEYPGAFSFRFVSMVIVILLVVIVFFHYLDESSKVIEQTSIQQTKRIIDSALVVVFSTLAARRELDRLNELKNSNPFEILNEFNLTPVNYRGEVDQLDGQELESGWYYVRDIKVIIYKPVYEDNTVYFSVALDYEDLNQNGVFDSKGDNFKRLYLKKMPR